MSCWACLQGLPCLTAGSGTKWGFSSASGGAAGLSCHQNAAHPDDQDRPADRGALRFCGSGRLRPHGRQAAGPHHPAAECRRGPRLTLKAALVLVPSIRPSVCARPSRCSAPGRTSGAASGLPPACPARMQAPTPEAKHLAEQAQLQADRNRAYYAKNRALHRSVVLRLTEQIRNCILVHQQPNARIARSGALDPERVWRAPLLNDSRVFRCAEEESRPSLHRGPAAGRFGFPAPLSGGHCGAGHDPGPEPCSLRHPGAGQQLLQPAGLYGSAGAQGLCGQKPAGDRPVFCIGLEPRRPCPAGGRRSGQL